MLFRSRKRGWSTHRGPTARPAGVQRGWIAQSNTTEAAVAATARVRQARPEIETTTSEAVVTPGASIHDVVTVTGLPPGYAGTVVAELHGPFATQPGPDDCTAATLAGRVTSRVTVDGTYETPSVVVPAVGHWTWVQRLPGDVDTLPVTTPCGLVEETTRVVPRTPTVATVVSDQRALVGARIFDTVELDGLAPDDTVAVTWRLHGPLRPRPDSSCTGLGWSRAAVAGTGTMTVTGSGTFSTPSVLLRAPGCYTYSQDVGATATTAAATSPPGLATETSLVTRPVVPVVPEVPSGRSTSDLAPRPVRVRAAAAPSPYVPQQRVEPRWLRSDYRAPATQSRRATAGTLSVSRVGVDVQVARTRPPGPHGLAAQHRRPRRRHRLQRPGRARLRPSGRSRRPARRTPRRRRALDRRRRHRALRGAFRTPLRPHPRPARRPVPHRRPAHHPPRHLLGVPARAGR